MTLFATIVQKLSNDMGLLDSLYKTQKTGL